MPTTSTPANTAALKDRVIKIITNPKGEWPVIEAEQTDTAKLYREYIAILAAIGPIASFISSVVFAFGIFRVGLAFGLTTAIVSYVLTLASVYVCALIIDKLAPTFDSTPNLIQALKLVAYAMTPAWVAGVANVIPFLGVLVALVGGLYSIYVFYLGLPVMMKTPEAKVVPYMAVSALVIIVLWFVAMMITGAVVGSMFLAGATF